MAVRRALHRRGLRYRVHQRPLPSMRRVADVGFSRTRVAVFVDGWFWHACPEHATWPERNGEWWRAKLERNRRRDEETSAALLEAGWSVVRVWEHEDAEAAADRIVREVRARRARLASTVGGVS
jgi:DNA mismatch endonuclease (patch repair protein)